MQLQFDATQPHQAAAVAAVLALFQGAPPPDGGAPGGPPGAGAVSPALVLTAQTATAVAPNALAVAEADLLANLHAVQDRHGLARDAALEAICLPVDGAPGPARTGRFPNFTLEMETGTGKTYVYIRTALALSAAYGLRKFVVVVPSVAIREGVMSTFRATRAHFRELFDGLPYGATEYRSSAPADVRAFAEATDTRFLVMTLDAFKRADTLLRRPAEALYDEVPLHLLQATRPVLILDEPQRMESDLSRAALAALDPLVALRYSATHGRAYNTVYRLTPADAYRQGLVKRIAVAGREVRAAGGAGAVRLLGVETHGSRLTARVEAERLLRNGTTKTAPYTLDTRAGAPTLAAKTGNPAYDGLGAVRRLRADPPSIEFANGARVGLGDDPDADAEAAFRSQLRTLIDEHFRQQEDARPHGVKVLSLCFVERVAHYDPPDSLLRRLFREEFDAAKAAYPAWAGVDAGEVQAAYFATKRRRDGSIEAVDTSGDAARDEDARAYELIMRRKEELLAFTTPQSFLFSHTALQEGWDNPNVCQIATLRRTQSATARRQTVGRGLRLVVDQAGRRVHDAALNTLTVVANESYRDFVLGYQRDTEAEWGASSTPAVSNARARQAVTARPDGDPAWDEFRALWERIRRRTRYSVRVDSALVVQRVAERLADVVVAPPTEVTVRAEVGVDAAGRFVGVEQGRDDPRPLARSAPVPDVLARIALLLEQGSPPLRVTRATLLAIFRAYPHKAAALANPLAFAAAAAPVVREVLAEHLVDGVRYAPTGDAYEFRDLLSETRPYADRVVPVAHSVFDFVEVDSDPERQFAATADADPQVRCFVKLPRRFRVPTPVGDYNPDWGVVKAPRGLDGRPAGRPTLYLVAETKGTTDLNALAAEERQKYRCGLRHFWHALGVPVVLATTAADLPQDDAGMPPRAAADAPDA